MLCQWTGADTRYCPAAVRVLVVALVVWDCLWQVLVQLMAVQPPQVQPKSAFLTILVVNLVIVAFTITGGTLPANPG